MNDFSPPVSLHGETMPNTMGFRGFPRFSLKTFRQSHTWKPPDLAKKHGKQKHEASCRSSHVSPGVGKCPMTWEYKGHHQK